jgi:GNAT superfamily N-acetyltransferase
VFVTAQRAGLLWVASSAADSPVGFARVVDIAGYAHLDEIDVLPIFTRHGIGSALLSCVCASAMAAGCPAVTLRTFREVAWNAPFYQRRGFRTVESAALSPGHVALEADEVARGLRQDIRVTMARATDAAVAL